MIKTYAGEKNTANHGEDHSGFGLSSIWYLPLFFLSGSTSGDVRWCPSLASGSLLETTRDLLCVADSFSCYSSHSVFSSQA